jgi:hypothetical protein
MMTDREKTDYWYRRFGRYVANTTTRAAGVEWWLDDNDRKHFCRHVVYQPAPIPVPPPLSVPIPTGGVFGRVLHDYEVYGMSRPEHNGCAETVHGLPETVPAADFRMVPLTPAWQWYSFNVLQRANPTLSRSEVIALFGRIMRNNAFKTNKSAPPKYPYANYVTGEGLQYDSMKTGVLWTGGAYLHLIGEARAGGEDCWKVKMLNVNRAPPPLDDFDGVHQTPTIFFATTSRRENNGTLVISLTGGPTIAVPSVAKADFALIAKSRVLVLPEGSPPPDPYNR